MATRTIAQDLAGVIDDLHELMNDRERAITAVRVDREDFRRQAEYIATVDRHIERCTLIRDALEARLAVEKRSWPGMDGEPSCWPSPVANRDPGDETDTRHVARLDPPKPGWRIIDGQLMYSCAWLNDGLSDDPDVPHIVCMDCEARSIFEPADRGYCPGCGSSDTGMDGEPS